MEALNMTSTGQFLDITHAGEPAHQEANTLIAAEYARHFKCEMKHIMPHSFNLTQGQNILACTGYMGAAEGELFLEQYLDEPIEDCLSREFTHPVKRNDIVEIGGFAVEDASLVLSFMFRLAPAFAELGFRKAVCTVTQPVYKYLKKLQMDTHFLATADPDKVDTSNNNWGDYYHLKPVVLAGDIDLTLEKIKPFKRFLEK